MNHNTITHANTNNSISEGAAEEFSADFTDDAEKVDLSQYEQYEQFGLEYNADNERFYYNDKLVRYFKDIVNAEGTIIGFSYTDGEVDLLAKRDSSYQLKELVTEPQKDFDQRTKELSETQNTLNGATSFEEGTPVNDDSLKAYENYGIKYEKEKDLWSYNGQIIRAFYDEGYQSYLSGDSAAKESNLLLIVKRDASGKIQSIDEMTIEQFNELFK